MDEGVDPLLVGHLGKGGVQSVVTPVSETTTDQIGEEVSFLAGHLVDGSGGHGPSPYPAKRTSGHLRDATVRSRAASPQCLHWAHL